MIRLTDVTVARGPNLVVEGLDLELEPGGIFWVVGPNGAGKTSLLRVIARLDAPRRGTVTGTTTRLRYFQSEMALPPSCSVRSWERLVRRVGRHRAVVGRTALCPEVEPGRRVGNLSTGQRKRLLLDAVLRQPGAIALDEPFEHLSSGAKANLHVLLGERARNQEVIVATNQHSPRAAGETGLHLEAGTARPLQRLHALDLPEVRP